MFSRVLLLSCLLAAGCYLALAAPQITNDQHGVCPALPVKLELRTSPIMKNKYQLVFSAPAGMNSYEWVDIHYRVNNDDSVNLRLPAQDAITESRETIKLSQVNDIHLRPGDALRAYATYSAKGVACDTPIHTFNAPDLDREYLAARMNTMADDDDDLGYNRELYWTAADEAELNESAGVCPSIPLSQDIMKISGLDNTYVVTFENRNPLKQLHYVDLHLSTDADKGWDNLRLASDMQLTHAHTVMQPGVVIKPYEQLQWYWSYRTIEANGAVTDCTTPVQRISPQQVTKEITMDHLNELAHS